MLGALAVVLLASGAVGAADGRAAVDAFVARLGAVNITSLVIDHTVMQYDPAGRRVQSSAEHRLYLKVPRRLRIERAVAAGREVRLTVGERVWRRTADGRTSEVSAADPRRDGMHLLVPFRRRGADLLAEWNALGVRTDVSHETAVSGRVIVVIGARPGERTVPQVWLDPERGVVRFITRERLPAGERLVDRAFSEHRPLVGAFVLPYRQEIFVDGKLVFLVVIRSAQVNTNPDEALFDPERLKQGG